MKSVSAVNFLGVIFFLLKSSFLYACDLASLKGYKWMNETFIPYCTDEELCKDKPELYVSDIFCGMVEFYKADIEDFEIHIDEERFSGVGKSFVIWHYEGGGNEVISYCDFVDGKCNFIRQFACYNRELKNGDNDFFLNYLYTVNGKIVGIGDDLLITEDEVLKFIVDRLPEDR
jgi:hypothetical protein